MNFVRTMRIVRGIAWVLFVLYSLVAFGTYFVVPIYESMSKNTTPLGHPGLLAAAVAMKAVGAVFLGIFWLQLSLFAFFVAGAIFSVVMLLEGGAVAPSLIFFFEFLVLGIFMLIWSRRADKSAG